MDRDKIAARRRYDPVFSNGNPAHPVRSSIGIHSILIFIIHKTILYRREFL